MRIAMITRTEEGQTVQQPKVNKAALLAALALAPFAQIANGQCAHGDLDDSGTVDLADYALFVECLSGPGEPPAPPDCERVDFDADGDVDTRDFATFERLLGPSNGALFGHRQFDTGMQPVYVAIGDLDGEILLFWMFFEFTAHEAVIRVTVGLGETEGGGAGPARDRSSSLVIGAAK